MTRFKTATLAASLGLFAVLIFAATSIAGARLTTFGTGQVSTSGTSATIVIDTGEFGGVYKKGNKQEGKLIGNVIFSMTSRGDVAGGAPRFSIPINDGSFDPNTDYAFIDAQNCGATPGDNPTNEATLVSTQNPACHVFWDGQDFANWETFVNGHPTFRIAKAPPFIIADGLHPPATTGTYVVTDIFL